MGDPTGRKVPGIGRRDATIMGIGEAPGFEESLEGRPWVGKAGRELRRYAERTARLPLSDWYLTNLVKYRPATRKISGNSPPTAEDIKRDEPELAAELLDIQPQWIVAIGRYSLRWLLGSKASVGRCRGFAFPLPDATLDRVATLTGQDVDDVRSALGTTRVVSVTHPAAGLHSTETQADIFVDFRRLGQIVRGELDPEPPVDRHPERDYRDVRFLPILSPRRVALDTEGLPGRVWGASVSWRDGMARVLRLSQPGALATLRRFILEDGHTFDLHNAPHDIRVICDMLGIDIYEFSRKVQFNDTMQMAFLHRLTPKALKDLGARYEGMAPRRYMEVVGPADHRIALDYLMRVATSNLCPACDGSGTAVVTDRRHKTTGKPLAPKVEKCPACEGDGTAWAPPPERLVWDAKKQTVRLSRGWRMGRRVRGILNRLADQEAAAREAELDEHDDAAVTNDFDEATGDETAGDDRVVAGLRRKWMNFDYDFRLQVEDRLGPMPEVTLDDVPLSESVPYSAEDADMTYRVQPKLVAQMEADDLVPVYEADRAATCYVTQMMHVGMKVDVPYLNELSDFLTVEMDQLSYKLERLAGHYVNPNSTDQVNGLLFGELGLKPIRLTSTGAESTDNKVLKDLQIQVAAEAGRDREARRALDVLTHILDYRERSKMKSTYTVALPRRVDRNSRIHTQFKQATVASRRLASAEPNLMNIPSRTKLGKKVKYAFTCETGNVLVDADYKQLEFRILAYAAGEQSLIDAVRNGVDLHSMTASMLFDVPLDKVTDDMWQRRAAKTINFAILYGASAPTIKAQLKLLANLDFSEETIQGWIDDYTGKRFRAIGEYIEDCIAHARRYGYAVDMWGHRRYLPGVHSDIRSVRTEAERVAVNHTIQSAASGIVKLAMAAVWDDVLPKFRRRGFCEPVLQLHDALTIEVQKPMAEEFAGAIVRTMSSVVSWPIPIDADVKLTTRWGAKEVIEDVKTEVAA